jgi:DNA-binding NarL/FixJ family response regulator
LRVRLVGSGNGLSNGSPAGGPIEVVLAGSQIPQDLSVGSGAKKPKVVSAEGIDDAFDLAGSGSGDVQVMIVDVDQFGVAFVRDLHIVFPSMKIVVLSRDPKRLVAALKAGATVALPSSTPSPTLAAVVARLLRGR